MKKIFGYSRKNGNAHDNINYNLHYLCRTIDIISNKSRSFSIRNEDGKEFEIAVFNFGGKYYAISNTCKHAGGPLSQGLLNGKVVTCPWHGWKYSIVDGKSPHQGGDSVDSYKIKVINGKLYVNLVPTTLGK
jgi:nitrite reductase/ring-hydroxylating ferredoxin subunit